MGPFNIIGSICHKNNGPIQAYWQHLPQKIMGPFMLIGSTCHKKKWANSSLLASPATKQKWAHSVL
jgi:hypothetical protein